MSQALKMPAGRGAGWVGDGWRIFAASPGMWLVLTIIWVLIGIAVQTIPLAGMLAGLFITPILGGGLLLAADDVRNGRELDVGCLFRPVTDVRTRNPILVLGGIYLGANMAVMLLILLLVLGGFGAALMQGHTAGLPSDPSRIDPAMLFTLGGITILIVLLILALVLLITLLFYFAIPLVAFGRAEPGTAISLGTRALLRNWAPLTILGLLYIPLSLLATIPLGLGWLILLPMTIGMWYASYRDVFPDSPFDEVEPAEPRTPVSLPPSPDT